MLLQYDNGQGSIVFFAASLRKIRERHGQGQQGDVIIASFSSAGQSAGPRSIDHTFTRYNNVSLLGIGVRVLEFVGIMAKQEHLLLP